MSQFPNLLRRSSFVTHDPLITRIYTSTPSSVSKHGDWGLKYPIHRKKGPRHIRFSNLDAGKAIGADWRSAEREARFIEQWGDGRTAWVRGQDARLPSGRRNELSAYHTPPPSLAADEAESKERYVPDVETMTEKEFEKFLEQVRNRKGAALERKLGSYKDAAIESRLKTKEDKTMLGLSARGLSHDKDGAELMARITAERLTTPKSDVLISQPHYLGGLKYSSTQPINTYPTARPSPVSIPAQYVDPSNTLPGRVLDQYDRQSAAYAFRGARSVGVNKPHVVSAGGLTGLYSRDQARARVTDIPVIEVTDYTRTSRTEGTGRFRVAQAVLDSDPTVLNLRSNGLQEQYDVSSSFSRAPPRSKSKAATPLDTFGHDIQFDLVSTPQMEAEAATEAESAGSSKKPRFVQLGSREYVAQDAPTRRSALSRSDVLAMSGLPSAGGPRSERQRGQASAQASAAHKAMRDQQYETIRKTLERIRGPAAQQAPQGSQGSQGGKR